MVDYAVLRRRRARILIVCAVVAVVVLGALLGPRLFNRTSRVAVPAVEGLDPPTARSRLAQAGLVMRSGKTVFSASIDAGLVAQQNPKAGRSVPVGSAVTIGVSGGSEVILVPDVLGMGLAAARKLVERKGLTVEVVLARSEAPSQTVLSADPAPGTVVGTGQSVRLTVARGQDTNLLLPSDLRNLLFVIDPAPGATVPVSAPTGSTQTTASATTTITLDASLEVARRLRALLEASGAAVQVTRLLGESTVTSGVRLRRATESSATAVVGLTAKRSGTPGLQLATPDSESATDAVYARSLALGDSLTKALRQEGLTYTNVPMGPDAVLRSIPSPSLRLSLGALSDETDNLSFRDSKWADSVARAIYRALATTFGPPIAPVSPL